MSVLKRRRNEVSHIARYASTAIKNPNLEVLRKAAEVVVGLHEEGQILDHYYSYYGHRQELSTKLAIRTRILNRGVGLSIDARTKALVFVGDPYGVQVEWRELINQVQQTYIGLWAAEAIRQIGWDPQIEEDEDN